MENAASFSVMRPENYGALSILDAGSLVTVSVRGTKNNSQPVFFAGKMENEILTWI